MSDFPFIHSLFEKVSVTAFHIPATDTGPGPEDCDLVMGMHESTGRDGTSNTGMVLGPGEARALKTRHLTLERLHEVLRSSDNQAKSQRMTTNSSGQVGV